MSEENNFYEIGDLNNDKAAYVLRDVADDTISFNIQNEEVLRLEPNGNIFVNGRLAEKDKEVVEGLRKFVNQYLYPLP